ncbi:hypothetical protein [Sphingomonas japonica]|uniref:Plasmid segregation centromere-binding protein ParG n=1 Tax=Sphingomonas japonica TaxID=511662 RepID=A0ABX0U6D9_9SPHN|nr:hypothetical protein [Sphingomonas japonica]NIJ24333.1 hypothetical protein [Sphingomonas japonica]
MFSNSKPTASLSSGLLARKGQARPAMRPQGFVGMTPTALEDLGWNDMGDAPVAAVTPDQVVAPPAGVPAVLRQREKLTEEVAAPQPVAEAAAAEQAPKTVPAAKVARIKREATAKGSKAAFTLRLDTDRHLRLRLASAVCNRSAQAIVTQALDAFLTTLPDVEELARQLPSGGDR